VSIIVFGVWSKVVVVNLDDRADLPPRLSDDLFTERTVEKKTKGSGGFEPELATDGLFDPLRERP
jgi:hypothetical protein